MYARPIPVKTKAHFKNLQFLAVTYGKGVLTCAFDVDGSVFIPPANFVCRGYTIFTLSVRPSVRASVRP